MYVRNDSSTDDYCFFFDYSECPIVLNGQIHPRKITTCSVYKGPKGFRLSDGTGLYFGESIAVLNPKDQFNKKIGRKIALKHVLLTKNNGEGELFSKSLRRLVWDEYFMKYSRG